MVSASLRAFKSGQGAPLRLHPVDVRQVAAAGKASVAAATTAMAISYHVHFCRLPLEDTEYNSRDSSGKMIAAA